MAGRGDDRAGTRLAPAKQGRSANGQAGLRTRKQPRRDDIPAWEWIVAAIGLALVLGAIGFMLYRALARTDAPPAIVLQVETVQPATGGYLVTFQALNDGEGTAAALVVEGALARGEETVESSTITIDYLPSRSRRGGGLYFTQDPRQFELRLRALGYVDP